MKAVAEVVIGPVAQAIGWALVHFVWQGVLLALVLAILLHAPGLRSPRTRYGLSFACLLAMVALPLVTAWVVYTPAPAVPTAVLTKTDVTNGSTAERSPDVHAAGGATGGGPSPGLSDHAAATPSRDFTPASPPRHEVIAAMLRWERIRSALAPYVPWCVLAWLLGVFVMGWRNLGSWFFAQRLRTRGVERVPAWVEEIVAALGARLGLRRAVACLRSSRITVPAALGWLKPVVLLPASSLLGLDASQLEAVLAHELAHIHRHDYLANLFQTLAETVLFYHPAVWWVSGRMRLERELCCDDLAVQLCASPAVYAGALVRVAELRQAPAFAMAASGGSLLARVRRLAQRDTVRTPRLPNALLSLGIVLGVSAALVGPNVPMLFAQESDEPPGARTIQFPEWTMGQIMIRPWGSALDTEWQAHQAAMGAVNVPEGMEVQLVVDNNAVTDLSPLSYLASEDLQSINFQKTEVQDEQLANIEGMQLRDLDFELTEISNEAVRYFEDMTSLERLSVGRTDVSNEGVSRLGGLTGLRWLDLNLTGVNDEGFAALENLRDLEYLDLWNAEISDETLRRIGTLKRLQVLGLEGARISDEALATLARLDNLENLVLENTPVSDEGVAYLQSLRNLARINLTGTRITDASAAILQDFGSLEWVSVPVHISGDFVRNLDGVQLSGTRHLDGQAFEVTVVEKVTGNPVAGAQIEVKPRRSQHVSYYPANLWTNEAGRASFRYTHVRQADVTVYASGYTPITMPWDMVENSRTTVTLERTQQIGGIVVNEDGEPVADVALALSIPGKRNYRNDSIGQHSEISHEDGNWQCAHAPEDLSALSLTLVHPEYAPTHYEASEMATAQLEAGRQVLIIRRGLELTGLVVDPDGNALPGASISELVRGRFDFYVASANRTQTDAEGNFRLLNQTPGALRLKVDAGGYLSQVEDFQVNEETAPLRFTLKAGGILRGKIVDQNGLPIEGVRIETTGVPGSIYVDHQMTSWKTATDAEGRFYWDEAPPEAVSLRFTKPGYSMVQKSLDTSDEDIVIVMGPPLVVSGRIRDAATGGPVPGPLQVELHVLCSEGTPHPYSHSLNYEDGQYKMGFDRYLNGIDAVAFQFTIVAAGYLPYTSFRFEWDEGRIAHDIALEPMTSVRGVDADAASSTRLVTQPH